MKFKKIIIALDSDNLKKTIKIVKELKNYAFAFKIGYQFFYKFGVKGYMLIKNENVKIFLDLKLHDIPNTVKKGIEAIQELKPYFLTVHISGGDGMLRAANLSKKNIKILGVSVLTSLDSKQTKKIYNDKDVGKIVSNFTKHALQRKIDGIVCSPKEISKIKKKSKDKLLIITPGIRPKNFNTSSDDQVRTMTPKEAIKAGADYLVIGRPITESKNPLQILKMINESIR